MLEVERQFRQEILIGYAGAERLETLESSFESEAADPY